MNPRILAVVLTLAVTALAADKLPTRRTTLRPQGPAVDLVLQSASLYPIRVELPDGGVNPVGLRYRACGYAMVNGERVSTCWLGGPLSDADAQDLAQKLLAGFDGGR